MIVEQVERMCDAGDVEVRLIEPRDEYDKALVGLMHKDGRWQAVYDVSSVVEVMMIINEDWDAPQVAEWLAKNVASTVVLLDVDGGEA